MIRHIESPGVEINEIDNSNVQYKKDYSLPNSPIAFYCGFADQGEDYSIQWINSYNTLIETYGYPTNEIERYFHFGMKEMLQRGGTVLASKLPYYNASKDNFSYVEYFIDNKLISNSSNKEDLFIQTLQQTDSNIKNILNIQSLNNKGKTVSGKLSIKEFDNLKVNASNQKINTIRFVDISRKKYEKVNWDCVTSKIYYENTDFDLSSDLSDFDNFDLSDFDNFDLSSDLSDSNISSNLSSLNVNTNEILGIVPIIVTPTHALFYQNLLNKKNDNQYNDLIKNKFNTIKTFNTTNIKTEIDNSRIFYIQNPENTSISVNLSNLNEHISIPFVSDNYSDYTFSKIAAEKFPTLEWDSPEHLSLKYLKQIGVVVCKFFNDTDNKNKISMSIVESFVGSLDPTAKDPNTKSSIFIDNIINTNSNYINMFSKVNRLMYEKADIIHIDTQTATSLGFYYLDTLKNLDYEESIIKPLNLLLNKLENKESIKLDIFVDAGLTNIAQFIKNNFSKKLVKIYNSEMPETNRELCNLESIEVPFKLDVDNPENYIHTWNYLANKIDIFCKNTRKDCIFLLDCPKGFCIENDSKIIRSTKPNNTIKSEIIPKLRYMTNINSNFSAGYCNWFLVQDDLALNNSYFWCPPSIKAAGVYCNTDVYFNTWDAPAGLTRGHVSNDVVDIAFNPDLDERNRIYSSSWNYAVAYPLDGIILEGQKTFQKTKTILNRINIRRLMLWLEYNVKSIAKYFVYEKNTNYVRQIFIDNIKTVLEYAVSKGGISDYYILCDETNNPPNIIDNNTLKCQISVKPINTLEFIVINFDVNNQSTNIQEIN